MNPQDKQLGSNGNGIPSQIKDIVAGFNTQSTYSNNIWLALITAAAVVLYPKSVGTTVTVPLLQVEVPGAVFDVVGYLILLVLFLAYCQAYAAAHQASQAGGTALKGIARQTIAGVRLRVYYDLLRTPTFLRVAPLAELLHDLMVPVIGKSGAGKAAAFHYLLLKLVANTVIFTIPIFALYSAQVQLLSNAASLPDGLKIVTWFGSLIGVFLVIVAMLVILSQEFMHVYKTCCRYWNGELPESCRPESAA